MTDCTMCPATMCPYLGLTDGSVWTEEQQGECESSCGWYMDDDGRCLAGSEHDLPVLDVEGPMPPKDMWPSCPYEDDCQWQAQRGDEYPCAPRAMLLMGLTVDETVMV